MNAVLTWVRNNVVIVIFVAVMLAASIALPLMARSMNAAVQADVKTRVDRGRRLDSAKNATIEQAGGSRTVTPNPLVVEEYRRYTEARQRDAEQLHQVALQHNRKGRTVLLPALFPQPAPRDREVLPERFHKSLLGAYDALLQQVRAGAPPTIEEIADELAQAEAQFRINTLKKGETEALTAEEAQQLQTELSNARVNRLGQTAEKLGMYLTRGGLRIPQWVQGRLPDLSTLFEWQWQYWITEDVLHALHEVNKPYPSLVTAPVKRVIAIELTDSLPTAQPTGQTGGGAGGFGFGGGGGGGGKRGRSAPVAPPGSADEEPPEEPMDESGEPLPPPPPSRAAPARGAAEAPLLGQPRIDPTAEAPLDFRVSFTGRKTNPLFDVRYVQVRLIAETAKAPQVVQALTQWNLMTVLDVAMFPASPFEAARAGYFYGDAPVSDLTITLETIWLREWTAPLMPPDLRTVLNISSTPAAG